MSLSMLMELSLSITIYANGLSHFVKQARQSAKSHATLYLLAWRGQTAFRAFKRMADWAMKASEKCLSKLLCVMASEFMLLELP